MGAACAVGGVSRDQWRRVGGVRDGRGGGVGGRGG